MQQQIRTDSSLVRERLSELAEILAAGLMRLRARKSSGISRTAEKVRWTVSPTRAVMPTTRTERRRPE